MYTKKRFQKLAGILLEQNNTRNNVISLLQQEESKIAYPRDIELKKWLTAIEPHLPNKLGEGSSRNVYDLGDSVVKIAKNPLGVKQNDEEIEMNLFLDNSLTLPLTKHSKFSWWIVFPKATPLTSSDELWDAIKIAPNSLVDLLSKDEKNIQMIFQDYEKYGVDTSVISDMLPQMKQLVKQAGLTPGDLTKADSWGWWKDKLYIIDYGLTRNSLKYK